MLWPPAVPSLLEQRARVVITALVLALALSGLSALETARAGTPGPPPTADSVLLDGDFVTVGQRTTSESGDPACSTRFYWEVEKVGDGQRGSYVLQSSTADGFTQQVYLPNRFVDESGDITAGPGTHLLILGSQGGACGDDFVAGTTRESAASRGQAWWYDGPLPGFDWEVRARLTAPEEGEVPDLPDEASEIQHDTYAVDFTIADNICQGAAEWLVDGEAVAASQTEPCVSTIEFPDEGERTVRLNIDGSLAHEDIVDVVDHLIVVLGDSIASGEGNPDVVRPRQGGYPTGDWVDDTCHRSFRSGHAQAALQLEESDRRSSVTLVHLACSGARTQDGLLADQDRDGTAVPAQIPRARQLVGDREVDSVLLSVGANDLRFADVAIFCAFNGFLHRSNYINREDLYLPCYDMYMSLDSTVNVTLLGLEIVVGDSLPVPENLDRVLTQLCTTGEIGQRSILVGDGSDLSDDYIVTLNYTGINYSGRQPTGPARIQETMIVGRPSPVGCGVTGAGGQTTTVPNPFFAASSLGAQVDIEDALDEPHPTRYFPEDQVVDQLPTESTRELVLLEPEFTLRTLLADQLVPQLEAGLVALAPALATLTDPENVHVVEYADPLTDDGGALCQQTLTLGTAPDSGIDSAESRFARAAVLGVLNTNLEAAAATNGWTFIGGPATDFIGHGLCASEPWYLDVNASLDGGSGFDGPIHPNAAGHAVIASTVFDVLKGGDPRSGATYEEVDDAAYDYDLVEFLNFSGDLVYVDPDAEIFGGDVILIETTSDAAELLQVIEAGPSSGFAGTEGLRELRVDPPAAFDHPPGSRVLVIEDLDELPPELGPNVPSGVSFRNEAHAAAKVVGTGVEVSRFRFPDPDNRRPAHVVLARVDSFADALAGSALTAEGPLLLTPGDSLAPGVALEMQRILEPGGRVYVLGGEVAIGADVVTAIEELGFDIVRLSGPTRIETALAVADVVANGGPVAEVLIARSTAPEGNPTAAWADSVAGGGWAADTQTPVLLTPSGSLHPAVRQWLTDNGVSTGILLGGTAALSEQVAAEVPGASRIAGGSRAETAVAISQQLWDGGDAYALADGFGIDGWAYGLIAAGVAADLDRPILLSTSVGSTLPAQTAALVAGCPDLAVFGDVAVPACWEGQVPG